MYLKIAICDDEPCIHGILKEEIEKICFEKKLEYKIDVFYTGEELCKSMESAAYELLFLEIELPGINGIEVGRYVRNNKRDEQTNIIYMSAKQSYAMELFDSSPMDFLIKPICYEKLERIIEKCIRKRYQAGGRFYYKVGTDEFAADIKDIQYFKCYGHKIEVVTNENISKKIFYGRIKEIYENLKGKGFLRISRDIIVNYYSIREMKYEKVVMKNEEILQISRNYRKEVRCRYADLLRGEEG